MIFKGKPVSQRPTTWKCAICMGPITRTHCEAAGCDWFICTECGLVTTWPKNRTLEWNGPHH